MKFLNQHTPMKPMITHTAQKEKNMKSNFLNKTLLTLCLGISLSVSTTYITPTVYAMENPQVSSYSNLRFVQGKVEGRTGNALNNVLNELKANKEQLPSEVYKIVLEENKTPSEMFQEILTLEADETKTLYSDLRFIQGKIEGVRGHMALVTLGKLKENADFLPSEVREILAQKKRVLPTFKEILALGTQKAPNTALLLTSDYGNDKNLMKTLENGQVDQVATTT